MVDSLMSQEKSANTYHLNIKPPKHRFGFSLACGWQYKQNCLENLW
jgi:hypothetical protein